MGEANHHRGFDEDEAARRVHEGMNPHNGLIRRRDPVDTQGVSGRHPPPCLRLSCKLSIAFRGLMRGADQPMPDAAAEEKGQSVGIHPPHHGPDAEWWALGRHDLQLH